MYRVGFYCLAAAVGVLASLPAHAEPYNWSGFYLGAHGGYGWADWNGDLYSSTHAAPNQAYGFDPSSVTIGENGWLGGVQIGHNEQVGAWVFGLELDASKANIDAGESYININKSFRWDVKTELEWLGTARARVGWASKDLLIFATAGAAYGRTSADLASNQLQCPTCPRTTATGSADENHFGYTVGGGFEWRLSRFWSLKSEYLYVDLGEADYHLKGTETLTGNAHVTDAFPADLELHTVRIGLNYDLTD